MARHEDDDFDRDEGREVEDHADDCASRLFRCYKSGFKYHPKCDCYLSEGSDRRRKGESDWNYQHRIRGVSPKDFI